MRNCAEVRKTKYNGVKNNSVGVKLGKWGQSGAACQLFLVTLVTLPDISAGQTGTPVTKSRGVYPDARPLIAPRTGIISPGQGRGLPLRYLALIRGDSNHCH